MIGFWILAAGLIVLALLFVLPPLLSERGRSRGPDRDELALALFRQQLEELDADLAAGALDRRQYQAARGDLERELLRDVGGTGAEHAPDTGGGRWIAALLAFLLPAVAVFLYLYLGNSALIPSLAETATAGTQTPATHPPGPQGEVPPLEVLVQRLADKLERQPDNLNGWMMLGRTYFTIGRPERALYALKQAYGLAPDNPDVLVAYAEAIAANHGNELAGPPAELIQSALKIDPKHTGARWLEGLVSFQAAWYLRAIEQWEALLATFELRSKEAAELERYIAEARGRVGPEPKQAPAQATDAEQESLPGTTAEQSAGPQPAASTTGIRVEVSLAEPLWPQADVKDTVFVYAKAVSGPPMPLAAYRGRVRDLPLTVTLDDSMALVPTMKLSGFDQVIVGARISKHGQAMPQSGDLEGEVGPVKPGQAGVVKVVIDRVKPKS